MKTKSLYFCVVLMTVMAIVACDDSSSGAGPDPVAEVSSSSGDEAISSSSVTDKGTSSGGSSVSSGKENSSSSAKSSSSTDSKSSSSVTSSSSGTSADSSAGSSSSSSKARIPCSEEDEMATLNGVDVICHDGYWVPVSSSSAVPTSSYFDMTNQFNEKVSYGEFTDPRDGQKYRTMEVKNGVFMESYTVFAENLNYGKMIPGGSVQGDSTKYCYDDDPWYCENGWGGLYTWSRAMNFPEVCDSVSIASEKCPNKFNLESDNEKFNGKYYFVQHQGICPEGWHIMNENEWVEVSEQSSHSSMSSKVAGFGNNSYGLSILPAGYWNPVTLEYGHFSSAALYWLPQQYPEYDDCSYRVAVRTNEFNRTFRGVKKQGFSVRCVENY